MTTFWLISHLALWGVVLALAFLLLGTLRSLGLLQWRFDDLEATRPVRKGREGLPPGKRAPDFTLPAVAGGDVSLCDFTGHDVLLVFTQSGCGPCHDIMPELNRVQAKGDYQVLVINKGESDVTAEWAAEVAARFPVATQEDWGLSKKYQVFATPYAFIVDAAGKVAAKGVASSPQYLGYLFNEAEKRASQDQVGPVRDSTFERDHVSSPTSKEIVHA